MLAGSITIVTLGIIGVCGGLFFLWMAVVSLREGQIRAVRVAACFGIGLTGLILITSYFAIYIQSALLITTLVGVGLAAAVFFLPIGKRPPDQHHPTHRVDERTTMFARHRLQTGSQQYQSYYALHPEHQHIDDRNRARPGLLSPRSQHASRAAFSAAAASFQVTAALHTLVDGEPAPHQHPLSAEVATRLIKSQARLFGAVDVGIARLQPYHIYSHIGRGPGEYGARIDLPHEFVIAFTVEMDHRMMQSAPLAAVVMESAHQYAASGQIAVQLAAAIRGLGYPARAHMDGNYRLICPPVARDAGLGEIGRISLLMTPRLGPRVRIGLVSTTLPLIPDQAQPDPAVIDFCTICKKCAKNCPSKAIPFGPQVEEDGTLRWKLNPEACFSYWNQIGTDCGICMAVCPFSHPDTAMHNLVRWGIARSGGFRRAALWMDDLLYGCKPVRQAMPAWLQGDQMEMKK